MILLSGPVAAWAVIGFGLAACGSCTSGSSSPGSSLVAAGAIADTSDLRGRTLTESLPLGFSWKLTAHPAEAEHGEPISLRLIIFNDSAVSPEVRLNSNPAAAAFAIRRHPQMEEVWSSVHGLESDLVSRSHTIPPGDSLVLSAEWRQTNNVGRPVPPGLYWIRGWLFHRVQEFASPPQAVVIAPR